ncbi:uncharacterized protein [Leptinotarsa decemlineata]|uniref:uncharacterized protein n=1 Tax=Leptinotarsa decemlineata TaxID=7539 RepID=UPI003D30B582
MKILIVVLAVFEVTFSSPSFVDEAFGGVTKTVVNGASGIAKAATSVAAGGIQGYAKGVSEVANGAAEIASGASHAFGEATNVIFGSHNREKVEYSSVFRIYNNLGVHFFPNYGCCSCPIRGVVPPGFPNYSPNSPFFINGVYPILNTEYCTCPPELVASAVQASHHNPGFLGNIAEYVEAIPSFGAQFVKKAANVFA